MPPTSAIRVKLWPRVVCGLSFSRFSPGTPVFLPRKIDSRPISSGCGAVLRGQTWVVFRGRAPSRQHSSFGPTSLSCALSNSVSDCEKGRLAGQILLKTIFYTPFASYFNFAIHKLVRIQFRKLLFVIGFP